MGSEGYRPDCQLIRNKKKKKIERMKINVKLSRPLKATRSSRVSAPDMLLGGGELRGRHYPAVHLTDEGHRVRHALVPPRRTPRALPRLLPSRQTGVA